MLSIPARRISFTRRSCSVSNSPRSVLSPAGCVPRSISQPFNADAIHPSIENPRQARMECTFPGGKDLAGILERRKAAQKVKDDDTTTFAALIFHHDGRA